MMKISVVIPTYNRQKVLIRNLKALLKQKKDILEIIIVDQTESYPTFLKKIIVQNPKIKYFYFKKKSTSAAKNYGWRKTKGEIVLFLDDDSIVLPGLIRAHCRNFQNPRVGAVTSREILEKDPNYHTLGKAEVITKTGAVLPNSFSIIKGEADSVRGGYASFRKSVLEEIEGFDENYIGSAMREESDLSLRLRLAGYKIIFEPKAKAIHLAWKTGGTRAEKKLDWYFSFFRNEIYFFLKFFPKKYLPCFFARKLRPILVCMFWHGRGRLSALKLPFQAFKNGARVLKKEKGKKAPLKIAIDAREAFEPQKAGKGEYTLQLIKNLAKIDHKNVYFLYTKNKIKEEFPANFQIRRFCWPSFLWHFRIILNIIGEGVDIVLSPTSYILPFLYPKKTIPVIYDLAVFKLNFKALLKAKILEKLLLARILKKTRMIIAISKSTKKDLVGYFPFVKKNKIKVLYPAIASSFKRTSQVQVKKTCRKYKISQPYILAVGTIEPRKNFKKLISAFAELPPPLFKKYSLIIVGKKGWYWQEVFKKVKELKLKRKVKFLGYVKKEEMPILYSGATLFVFPSLWEGFGLPILESLNCGTPVMTSSVSSMPEAAGQGAFYVNPQKTKEIAKILTRALENGKNRKTKLQIGMRRARNFSWEKSTQKLIKLWQELQNYN